MSQALSALRNDTGWELLQVKGTVESISNDLHEKIDAVIVDTRKETEVNAKSKSLVEEMHKYKGSTENELKSVRQDFRTFKEEVSTDCFADYAVSGSVKVMEEAVAAG
jgi:hypothetical protein